MRKGKKRPFLSKKDFERSPELYRARMSCRIGRDALDGKVDGIPVGIPALEYAMYNLLHAVEDMAAAMMPKENSDT